MPSGACVIKYSGARGVVWRIKWRDAEGRQVKETIGAERDGVTRKQAEAELRERLVRVERKGYRRPKRLTFAEYTATWQTEGELRRRWKPATVKAYRVALARLEPFFGPLPLGTIRPRDVARYQREQLERYAARTVATDLNVLHDVFKTAVTEELVDSNPVAGAERPRAPKRCWRILDPVEFGAVLRAFTDARARIVFLTLMLTGVRSSELRALRWRDVDLVESVLRIREAKSEEGERSIALAPTLAEELWQHRRASAFQGEEELVFGHPERGTRLDTKWYAEQFKAALTTAGIADYVRPFHDVRHASLTNGAAGGEQPIALMARAGHRSMSTTKQYLHLAGVVFRDEAAALERRLLGGGKDGEDPVGRQGDSLRRDEAAV